MDIFTKTKIVTLFLSVFYLGSCINTADTKGIDEGIMKYSITYLEDEAKNPLISLMPSHLTMSFKDDCVNLSVEGWMSVFKSTFIKKSGIHAGITTLKIMDKKVYYECNDASDFMGMSDFSKLKLTFDDQVKDILGFACNHCVAVVVGTDVVFDVFYTTEIDIEDANDFTPFENVPGVLMEFELQMNGIPMHLIAANINNSDVESSCFDVPEGYSEVEKQVVDDIFSSLVE